MSQDAVRYSGNPGMEVNGGPDHCYEPCDNGIHIVGEHPDGVNCFTVANLSTQTAQEARALWDAVKAECEITEGEPHDLVVDLMMDTYHEDDFLITRQMLDRLIRTALHPNGRGPWAAGG